MKPKQISPDGDLRYIQMEIQVATTMDRLNYLGKIIKGYGNGVDAEWMRALRSSWRKRKEELEVSKSEQK